MAKRSIVLQKKNALACRMVARAWGVIDAPRLGYPLSDCVPAIPTLFHRARMTIYEDLIAEPKFEDCVRCAVAAMSDLLEERNAPSGVYWHDQDDKRLERGEDLNIGFVGA